jgi:hypothetical protein
MRVRFNEAANREGRSAYSADEARRSWFQTEELLLLQNASLLAAKTIISRQCGSSPLSYPNIVSRIHSTCLEEKLPSEQLFQLYVRWNLICPDRRGYERLVAPAVHSALNKQAASSVEIVLALQSSLQRGNIPIEQIGLRIQSEYKRKTQPAVVLARINAIADAIVARTFSRDMKMKTSQETTNSALHTQQRSAAKREGKFTLTDSLPIKKRKLLSLNPPTSMGTRTPFL